MSGQPVRRALERLLPLARWRVRTWEEPNGTWSARYRRARFRGTEGWSVHGCATREQSIRVLTAFVHEESDRG